MPGKRRQKKRVKFEDGLIGDGLEIFQPRNDFNNTSKKTLADYGSGRVMRLVLSRSPIKSFLRRAVNTITLGTFETAIRKYGYDRVFHLSAIADIEHNGIMKRVVIEKNAVINISTRYTAEREAEYYNIDIPNDITLLELIENTRQRMGASFFPYNAFDNNCQIFIDNLLSANGLNTSQSHEWLFQDVSQLKTAIPEASRKVINTITDVAGVADRLAGNGVNKSDLERVIEEVLARLK
jgi:hypothetical protein